jgi:hypothetical protein
MEKVNNKFTRAVYLWLDNIIAGFITEFAVDTTKLYTVPEQDFLKGPRGRYIRSLYTCAYGGTRRSNTKYLRYGEGFGD